MWCLDLSHLIRSIFFVAITNILHFMVNDSAPSVRNDVL